MRERMILESDILCRGDSIDKSNFQKQDTYDTFEVRSVEVFHILPPFPLGKSRMYFICFR